MRRLNSTVIALLGGLIILVLLVVYFAANRNSNQDKLSNAVVSANIPPSHEKLCASKEAYDLIKAELFRRAAQLRGSDQAAYDKVSGFAVVRMENPVMESEEQSTGAVNCSGFLSLDLPPGVAVAGGRQTLSSDVDYSVRRAADGSGTAVVLRNAEAIITPLATLTQVARPAPQPVPSPAENAVTPETSQGNGVEAAPPAPAPAVPRSNL